MSADRSVPPNVATLLRLLGRPGDVPVRVRPVADHERLSRLVTLLARIDGVDGLTVQRFDGHDALLVAHVVRAAEADDILVARLARGMVSCAWLDDRIDIEVVPRSTGSPTPPVAGTPGRFDVPPGLRALRITPPLREPARPPGPVADAPAPAEAGSRGEPVTGARAGPATRRAEHVVVDGPPGPRAVPRTAPPPGVGGTRTTQAPGDRLVELALRSIIGRSLLVCDTAMRVLTATGIAWPRSEVPPGAGVRELVGPQLWALLSPALAAAVGGGTATVEFDGPGGERFEATCTPVVDDGIVVGATAVARDLAVERDERAEQGRLRDEFGAVFEQSPVAQGLLSLEGRWVRVNAELCAVLGEAPVDLVGAEATAWVPPRDRRGHRDAYAGLLAGLEPGRWATFRILAARGHLVTVRAHVAVLRTPSGWPRGAIVQLAGVLDA